MLFIIHILFICLFPLCGYVIYRLVKVGKKIFSAKVIFELPYKDKQGIFLVEESGRYSIWQRGKLLSRAPVDKFRPLIWDANTSEEVRLYPSLLRPHSNNGSMASMELFRFHLPAGQYTLEYGEGSSISALERMLSSALVDTLIPPADLEKYSLQIRQSAHPLYFLLFIFLMLLAFATFFGGVFGLAFGEQWFGDYFPA